MSGDTPNSADNQRSNRGRRIQDLHSTFLHHFSGQVELSIQALKVALLLNGAAAVALLAFIGRNSESPHYFLPVLLWGLGLFLAGVFVGGLSSGLAYFSAFKYTRRARDNYLLFLDQNTVRNDILDPELPLSPTEISDDIKEVSDKKLKNARQWQGAAGICTAVSFVSFLVGSILCLISFALF